MAKPTTYYYSTRVPYNRQDLDNQEDEPNSCETFDRLAGAIGVLPENLAKDLDQHGYITNSEIIRDVQTLCIKHTILLLREWHRRQDGKD